MCSTRNYAGHMSKMIQIRHVPDALHRKLKTRAAQEGRSLSDYLRLEIERLAELPTIEEMKARLAGRSRVDTSPSPTEIIRAARDSN